MPVNGILQTITIPATGGLSKYTRPVFGNGRVYVSGGSNIISLGTPVNLPLSCSPVNFGTLHIGQTTTAQITCTAKTSVTINGCTTSLATFGCSNSSLPTTVASGSTFSFPVTWDLTQTAITNAKAINNYQTVPGSEVVALNVYTTASGYASMIPIQLSGTVTAPAGYLTINATQVDFTGLVLGTQPSKTLAFTVTNDGNGPLTFTGFAWQDLYATGSPYNNVSVQPAGQPSTVGNGFTATNFPTVNSQLSVGQYLQIPVTFSSTTSGKWASLLTFWSDSGTVDVMLTGTAATAAIATLSISDGQGNWLTSLNMAFGNVPADTTAQRQIRLCNGGGSALTITLSTPPSGPYLTALDPEIDLVQGSTIRPGNCSYGNVDIIAPPIQPNHPSIPLSGQWLINTNGDNAGGSAFTLQTVSITATVVSRQVGPLLSNGVGLFQFKGCYLDTSGRNLKVMTNIANNSIEACMAYCNGLNYPYMGLEYRKFSCF